MFHKNKSTSIPRPRSTLERLRHPKMNNFHRLLLHRHHSKRTAQGFLDLTFFDISTTLKGNRCRCRRCLKLKRAECLTATRGSRRCNKTLKHMDESNVIEHRSLVAKRLGSIRNQLGLCYLHWVQNIYKTKSVA